MNTSRGLSVFTRPMYKTIKFYFEHIVRKTKHWNLDNILL